MAYYTVKSTEAGAGANTRIITLDMNSARQAMHAYNNCIMFDENGNEIDRKKTAFKFSELESDRAKDRVRNWHCEGIELWTENYTDFLTMCGFAEPKLYYSVCYSQSDYVAFESCQFDYEKGFVKTVERNFGKDSEFHKLAIQLRGIYARSFYRMRGKVKTNNRDRARCDMHYDFDFVEDDLNEWINDACNEIKSGLYADWEHQSSDESVSEMCDANEYTFDEDGGVI